MTPWRRRAVLALLSQAWVVQGGLIAAGAWAPIAIPALVEAAPLWILALAWASPGVLGLVSAACPRWEARGFGAVMTIPSLMVASWLLGSLVGATGQDLLTGVGAAWTWATVAALVWIVAGWPEIDHACDLGGEGG